MSKKGMGTAKNAMMVNETGNNEEDGNESASACVIEEVKLGQVQSKRRKMEQPLIQDVRAL